ncbi:MAG: hypothetical protein GX851_01670 [Clostridiales bacterium]|nr:hypothetical protein [Clostridiales bacterium]
MGNGNNCEYCFNYVYDEEYDCYICQADLDMDELERFTLGRNQSCPYYTINDEYKAIVEKQN